MNSSTISTSPEAVRRDVDAMPHANLTGLCRQIPGTGNPRTAAMKTTYRTYRILQEDKELPTTYITNPLDAQKHFLLQCFKYAGSPKKVRAMVREVTSIDASGNPDIKEKLDFIADAESRVHHVAVGCIPGKSDGAEKLKAILGKNIGSIRPEKLMFVVKANNDVLTPDDMRGVRASIGMAREDSPICAYFDKNQKHGIHWYLILIGGTQ